MKSFSPPSRRGFTLIEFVIAAAIVSVLMLGMGAAVSTAMRSAELGARGASARTSESARLLEQITADLRLALVFTEPLTAHQVEFTVPDRDEDGLPERVTWTWSGSPDYLLTRQEWLSASGADLAAVVVAEDVRNFDLTYVTKTWGAPPPPAALPSEEVVLIAHDDTPEGDGTRALLVTTSAGSPTFQEQTREGLLNWWGFTVSRIGAKELVDAFDAAVAVNDVVYVPSTINAAHLDTKLASATIGVVNEHADLLDDFGLATGPGPTPGTAALDILNQAHFITAPLNAGPLSLFTSSQPTVAMPVDAADRAPGARDLGAWASSPALSVVEVDEKLYAETNPTTVGYDTVFGEVSGVDDFDQKYVATRITLTTGATIQSLSAYLDLEGDKDFRFGIYSDIAGEPGILLGESDKTRLDEDVPAWRTIALQREVELPPGTYWLTIGMQKDTILYFSPTGGQTRYADSGDDPKDGLMESWAGTYGPEPNEQRISVRANGTAAWFAPGRRVMLPWGGSAVDMTALTDAAKQLMQGSVEWAADTTPGDDSTDASVGNNLWVAQHFQPTLPVNAVYWSITRVLVAIRADPEEDAGKVQFELRYPNTALVPGEVIIQETAEIPNVNWDPYSFTWYEIPFTTVSNINPDTGICLVLKGAKDPDAFVKLDTGALGTSGTHFVTSVNDGNTWSTPNNTDDMRFYVFGTYATEGLPVW